MNHSFFKIIFSFAWLLSGCSTLNVINSLTPDEGSNVEQNVSYGALDRQKLDIYRPIALSKSPTVLVFFYGGAWDSGEKSQYEFVARAFGSLGHYVVIPNYRIFPEVTFPQFIEDGAAAVNFVYNNMNYIAKANFPVFLVGHSAGAQIAMLLGLDPRYLAAENRNIEDLGGVIGLAGPYNFLPLTSSRLKKIFPSEKQQYEAQAINFVGRNKPPIFIGHGDKDTRVFLGNSVSLSVALDNVSATNTFKIYKGASHTDMLKPFVSFLNTKNPVIKNIMEFIEGQQFLEDKVDR